MEQTNAVDTLLVVAFTISFQLIVGFILSNIVMAVLLDKFTEVCFICVQCLCGGKRRKLRGGRE